MGVLPRGRHAATLPLHPQRACCIPGPPSSALRPASALRWLKDVASAMPQVSLANWNQDERFGAYGGAHAMVLGGYGRVTDALAAQIRDLRLNSDVCRVEHTPDHVDVHLRHGEVLRADAVIVSVPIGVLKTGAIEFAPSLPAWKQTAISRIGMGKLSKVSAGEVFATTLLEVAVWSRATI